MASAVKIPQLRRVITAYGVNRLGTWIGVIALMVATYDHTHNALAVAAVLVAGQALPAFAVPAIIARVEASPRRGELSALYFFEAAATAALAVLVSHFWLPGIVLLVALDGTAALAASALLRAQVARTAREHAPAASHPAAAAGAADLPETDAAGDLHASGSAAAGADTSAAGATDEAGSIDEAGEAEHAAERDANAALNVAFSFTFVLGPVLGGAIAAAWGASQALLVDVGSFLVCGALLFNLRPHVEEAAGASVRERLSTAWAAIQSTPPLPALLLAEGVAFMFFEAGAPIELAYAKTTLQVGARGFGLLLTAWGAGTIVGSLVFARSSKRPLGYLLSAGTLGVGIAYIGFAAAPSLLLASAAALVGGIGNGTELPSLFSIVQRLAPPQLHGQMMGAVESLGALAPAIGLPLGGALVVLSSPRPAFVVVGAGTAATAFALLLISGPTRGRAPAEETAVPAPPALDGAPGDSVPREPAAR